MSAVPLFSDAGNVAEELAGRSRRQGWLDRTAFHTDEGEATFGEVHDAAARMAGVLATMGVSPGTRVLIACADGLEWVQAFLGAARLGAVAVPVNPWLAPAEHEFMLADATPSAVVCDGELVGRLEGAAPALAREELAAELARHEPRAALGVQGDVVAYGQYTSGTTGAPKLALHRHRDLLVFAEAVAARSYGLGPDDVIFSVSKLFFAYGLGNSLAYPLWTGARAVLHAGRPKLGEIAERAIAHGVTVMLSVPTFYANVLAQDPVPVLDTLRLAVVGGEQVLPALVRRWEQHQPGAMVTAIGSTEIGQTFATETPAVRRPGSCGKVLRPYDAEIRDDDGTVLPAGESGQLWLRGPTVLLEYFGRPDATAGTLVGGWLRSGDIADRRGRLPVPRGSFG